MNTRITIDLQEPALLMGLKLQAVQERKALREVVVEALQNYLSHKKENQNLMKLAEASFQEWDNPKDAEYDRL